jgi:hypothetical protein
MSVNKDDDGKKMMALSLISTTARVVTPNQEGDENKVSIRSHFLYNENIKQQKN